MQTYSVRLPITGFIDIDVEAEDELSAVEAAVQQCTIDDISEWEPADLQRAEVESHETIED